MADTKLSALTELAALPAVDDEIYIRDVSEAAADESKRITVANLAKASLLTSRMRAYMSTAAQPIPASTTIVLLLDAESFDTLGEFDNSVKSGAADATEANKLHDADGGFAASDVGATLWNTTDNTYTKVSAFVDSGELTLTDNIMVDTENYKLFWSRFVATVTGYYLIKGSYLTSAVVAGKDVVISIYVNGSSVAGEQQPGTGAGFYHRSASDIVYLEADDYVQLVAYHTDTTARTIYNSTLYTWMSIHRLS